MNANVKYSTIIVRSTEESVKFYSDVMGLCVDSRYNPKPGTVITLMRGKEGAMVELIEDINYGVGLYSVGMEVEDMESAINELKAKNVKIKRGPSPTLVGSVAFLEDPNDVTIALIEHNK